ncbi:thioester reductase domain-containing protein [Myceligenerans crystallogenes]|uniref:Carboxylic acid reductase n=1 Tax=Myceligenerans crystallogenes TaxID=316335 RepID=A0ABN2N9B2_9MICO
MHLARLMTRAFDQYSARPALAERRPVPRTNEQVQSLDARQLDHYDAITYAELSARVRSVAAQLTAAEPRLAAGDVVAFLGYAGIDYVTADLACNLAGLTTVPLQTSASAETQQAILDEIEPRAIVVTSALLARAAVLTSATPTVERVLVTDHRGGDEEHRRRLAGFRAERGIVPQTLDLSPAPFTAAAPGDAPGGDHPAMLLYTSGSTGAPKGAIYPEHLVAAMWGGDGWAEFFAMQSDVSNFHYMPMSHVAGHSSVRGTLARGGLTHFASSHDLADFFEDLRLAEPTELSLVPRICELIFQEYQRRLQAHGDAGARDDEVTAASVRAAMRTDVFGGRVGWASCTSAPVSPQLKQFMEDLLGIKVHELYGTTEIGGVLSDGSFLSPPVIDYRLEDVPELGYHSTDLPDARGELLVRSRSTVPGYFRRPELNARVFTPDGYYRTGDIAAVDATGTVRIVDRRNAIIKLSQGEFVALPSLEATYASRSPALSQVFLYGNSARPYTLAVAVPSPELVGETGGDTPALHDRLLAEFRRVAQETSLNSYEIPRDLVVETEPFSEANGLLSDHRKIVRPALTKKYGPALEALYEQLGSSATARLAALRESAASAPVLDTVRAAVGITLGGALDQISPAARFRDLGGDSLTAVELSRLLEQVLGVRVPVNTLTSETGTIDGIARVLDARRRSAHAPVSPGGIHTRPDGVLLASELSLPRFLGQDFRPASADRAAVADADAAAVTGETVLVTGANGYLGRFLALELLRRAARSGGRVVCLVRAHDDDAARHRLRQVFATDHRLADEIDRLAPHLEVLAGDLAEPGLGLAPAAWERLARDVDRIYHAGAMVNHALSYHDLFDANVGGTAEIIRLAATTRRTPVVFVSSIATALLAAGGPPLDEHADIRHALARIAPRGGNVEGYAASKWAGEVLLREAHEHLGLPVTVIRASMILAHSTYRGQINVPDTFSRLLYSLALTGVAPASFYAGGTGRRAHYDGLPVDVVAASIVDVSRPAGAGHTVCHLVNPLDDGVSLDSVVDWLAEAGVRITRIADHAEWFERFSSSLRSLADDDRRASVLPLLDNFATPEPAIPGSRIPAERFTEHLRAHGDQDRIRSLDPGFAEKSLADLELAFSRTLRR